MAARDAMYRTASAARSALARDRTWNLLFLVAAGVSFLGFLYAARQTTFWLDEWGFIVQRRGWDFDAFMRPHNEHWIAGALVVYKLLLAVFGLRTYVPFVAVLLALQVLTAAGLYRLVAVQLARPIALGASLLVLFLGSSAANFFWAFQMTFVGAAAAGTWAAALLLERPEPTSRRLFAVASLLLVAVATSGVGLFFVAAIGALIVLSPQRRRQWWVLLPALIAYGLWSLAFAHNGNLGLHLLVAAPSAVAEFVVTGIGSATGQLLGIGETAGWLVAGLLIVWALLGVIGRRSLNEIALVGLVGLLAQYVLIALVRAQFGPDQAAVNRYVGIAAIFLLMVGGAWLASAMPARWTRLRTVVPLAVIAAWALTANVARIHGAATTYTERAFETRAAIAITSAYAGSPALPDNRGGDAITGYAYLAWFPSPAVLREIEAQYGLPPDDVPIPAVVMRRMLFQLVSPSISVVSGSPTPEATQSIAVERSVNMALGQLSGGCLAARPLGDNPWLAFSAPGGATIHVTPDAAGALRMYLSPELAFAEDASRSFQLAAGAATAITVPDLGDGSSWHVRLDMKGLGAAELCLAQAQAAPPSS